MALRPNDLTRPVIIQWFHEIGRYSRTQANKSLSLLRTMFTRAEEWQLWEGENPVSRIRWFPTASRTRFVQPEEMPKLLASLAVEPPVVQAFFLTCLLTGCLGGEARKAQWADMNLVQGLWNKPTTKSGRSHQVPLPPVLMGLLSTLPRTDAWVFAFPDTELGPLQRTTCYLRWMRIRKRARLEDVTIHDLRRTCASWLSISGENIAVVGKILNHSSLQHTAIYARLNQAPVKAALSKHADTLLGMGSAPVTESAPSTPSIRTPAPTTPPPHQTPAWSPSRGEEREEWPG